MGEKPDGSRKIHARVGLPKSTSPRGENCRLLRDRLPIPLQSASGWASTEAGAIPKRRFGLIHRNPGSGEENRAASSQETWPIRRRRYDLRGGRIGDLPERASAPPWPVLSRPRARFPASRPDGTGGSPCDGHHLSGSSPFFSPCVSCTSSHCCPDGCSPRRAARSPHRTPWSCSIRWSPLRRPLPYPPVH